MKRIETALGQFFENLFASENAGTAYRFFFKLVIWTSIGSMFYTAYTWGVVFFEPDFSLAMIDKRRLIVPTTMSFGLSFICIAMASRGRRLLDQNNQDGFWYLAALTVTHTFSIYVLIGFYGVYCALNTKFRQEKLANPSTRIYGLLDFLCLTDEPAK